MYFSRFMRVVVDLIMLLACTKSRFPCFLMVIRVCYISSSIGPCFHWLEDCANFMPTPEEYNQYSANY